jgi:hypothetical protein
MLEFMGRQRDGSEVYCRTSQVESVVVETDGQYSVSTLGGEVFFIEEPSVVLKSLIM